MEERKTDKTKIFILIIIGVAVVLGIGSMFANDIASDNMNDILESSAENN